MSVNEWRLMIHSAWDWVDGTIKPILILQVFPHWCPNPLAVPHGQCMYCNGPGHSWACGLRGLRNVGGPERRSLSDWHAYWLGLGRTTWAQLKIKLVESVPVSRRTIETSALARSRSLFRFNGVGEAVWRGFTFPRWWQEGLQASKSRLQEERSGTGQRLQQSGRLFSWFALEHLLLGVLLLFVIHFYLLLLF